MGTDNAYSAILFEHASDVAKQIRSRFSVERILLFGSCARGEARQSSDRDILVIGVSEFSYKERKSKLYSFVDPPCEINMLWYTPEELSRMKQMGISFIRYALNESVEL